MTCKAISVVLFASLVLAAGGVRAQESLPDPDGKPADLRKKVQVYVLLGLSLIHI